MFSPYERTPKRWGRNIVKSADTSVWGVVFAVSEEDLVRDSFEGVPQSYTRDRLEVTTQNGTAREVWSYFAVSQCREFFGPHSEYLALYLSGAQHFGLPPNYIEKLRRIRTADNA